ncbi:TKL protein kinase [Phytophthora nicotianae]|uniref:TKL protein kinase n=2 Tax=Phytophthora nicotianae TaxID=4792 RepID=W2LCN9_PHYNI|nr:TKL protein kinase [Phytophthora nicotianae]
MGTSVGKLRRLEDATPSSRSYLDADLPSDPSSFAFDGTNSDLARQLYYRSLAGDSADQLNLSTIPSKIQDRLDDLDVNWADLDGIAQRAVLWDTGFGISSSDEPVQIFTDGSHSIANLAVPISQFAGAGCTWTNCSQPDGSISYSNLACNAVQMLSKARCFAEDFEDDTWVLSPTWSTGGWPPMIPTPRVYMDSWTDPADNNTYTVFAIHTLAFDQEPFYSECPNTTRNGGYGSLVVPCAPTARVSASSSSEITPVEGSPWVSRWIAEEYSTKTTPLLSTSATVGIITGCIVVVLVILGFIIACKHRSKKNKGQTGLWDDDIITAKRIPRNRVQVDQLLSRGAFGEVYAGAFNDRQVAVKMLLPSTRRDIRLVNEFLAEARLTACMEHPRIVTLVGVAWDTLSDLCIVLEFMEGGDLRSLLNNYEKAKRKYPVGFSREKVTIALHVCHALTYLHSLEPPVIHRDLKSRNILLDEMHEAKLTDFGISRERLDRTMTAGVGTSLWMAPEVMMGEKYDDKADIFSFGVVLSELDLHTLPYAQIKREMERSHGRQMSDATLLQRVAMGATSVEFSDVGPQSMVDLGRACVSVDPSKRPCAAEALFKLQVVLSKDLA